MINVLTVHWKSDMWIDIQLKYLKMNIDEPFRVYSYLNYISTDHSDKFFYSSVEPITSHARKLNLLAEQVASHHDTKETDILIFLDGDAFPIKQLMPFIYQKLEQYPLIAVQRLENNDVQPHPSFCATTVGFWQTIKGDWNAGYKWKSQGAWVTDVGGNLLQLLNENKENWHPLLRSNTKNYHPLFFGIYDDLIYHHGAGFREKVSKADDIKGKLKFQKLSLWFSNLINYLPKNNKYTFFLIHHLDPMRRIKRKTDLNNLITGEKIYQSIQENPLFYEQLIN